ncbi:phosphoadenylyl-sulfate reductase [Aristophania vespae]|uniref:Adenosine 5'-phosphosulfate reductase n=1 Tax=Aristophania vespae TaxID=2697033 RepID=A0A6P1NMU8_9PROT|nr:phosphoadenylyl-sulfate reductase [Aristophania vespae]QHI96171.1 phosphoadenylyl-sulfate reductase [Aristophania vespae]
MALTGEELGILRQLGEGETPQKTASLVLSKVAAQFAGRVALISSFGAESAVLLALLAQNDPQIPVYFLDTKRHFPETLLYRDQLVQFLGLKNLRILSPSDEALKDRDPQDQLAGFDPDACCALRKVEPLEVVLPEFDLWLTGRKRMQSLTRAALPVIEPQKDGTVKINPLAQWQQADITHFMREKGLPQHPLVAKGYLSIGCVPCTRPVKEGEDSRAGRWAGKVKMECGIHRPVPRQA